MAQSEASAAVVFSLWKRKHPRSWLRDETGLSTLEYAVLFVVIVVGGLLAWQKLGSSLTKQVESSTLTFEQTLSGTLGPGSPGSGVGSGPVSTVPTSASVGA